MNKQNNTLEEFMAQKLKATSNPPILSTEKADTLEDFHLNLQTLPSLSETKDIIIEYYKEKGYEVTGNKVSFPDHYDHLLIVAKKEKQLLLILTTQKEDLKMMRVSVDGEKIS